MTHMLEIIGVSPFSLPYKKLAVSVENKKTISAM